MSNSGVHTESWTENFIWTTEVDSSNSANNDQVQVLSFNEIIWRLQIQSQQQVRLTREYLQ